MSDGILGKVFDCKDILRNRFLSMQIDHESNVRIEIIYSLNLYLA